ncbi:CAP domain-containing protein [Peribacillus sp. SCS-155]|uniref:CAP domain-containing protein n=1 Tax=Peribacillus sedimenti TaxID=3115297 RepID=UPI003905D219
MKKYLTIIFATFLFLSSSSVTEKHVLAASKTFKWGKIDYQVNLIGKISVLKDTKSVIIKNGKLIAGKTYKKGTEVGVTNYRKDYNGLYEISKGMYIKKSTTIKYYSLSKDPLADSKFEKDFISRINQERKNQGLTPLVTSSILNKAAKFKSADMVLNKDHAENSRILGTPESILANNGMKNYIDAYWIQRTPKDLESTIQEQFSIGSMKERYLSYKYDEIGVGYINHQTLGKKLFIFLVQTKEKEDPNLISISTLKELPEVDYMQAQPSPAMNTYSYYLKFNHTERRNILNGKVRYIHYQSSFSPVTHFNKEAWKSAYDIDWLVGYGGSNNDYATNYIYIIFLDNNRQPIGFEEERYDSIKIKPTLAPLYKEADSADSIRVKFQISNNKYLYVYDLNAAQPNEQYAYYTIHYTDQKKSITDLLESGNEEFKSTLSMGVSPNVRFKNIQVFYATVIAYNSEFQAVSSLTKEFNLSDFK